MESTGTTTVSDACCAYLASSVSGLSPASLLPLLDTLCPPAPLPPQAIVTRALQLVLAGAGSAKDAVRFIARHGLQSLFPLDVVIPPLVSTNNLQAAVNYVKAEDPSTHLTFLRLLDGLVADLLPPWLRVVSPEDPAPDPPSPEDLDQCFARAAQAFALAKQCVRVLDDLDYGARLTEFPAISKATDASSMRWVLYARKNYYRRAMEVRCTTRTVPPLPANLAAHFVTDAPTMDEAGPLVVRRPDHMCFAPDSQEQKQNIGLCRRRLRHGARGGRPPRHARGSPHPVARYARRRTRRESSVSDGDRRRL